jgi:hypothetical protein
MSCTPENRRSEYVKVICEVCGHEFELRKSQANRFPYHYCNKQHASEGRKARAMALKHAFD